MGSRLLFACLLAALTAAAFVLLRSPRVPGPEHRAGAPTRGASAPAPRADPGSGGILAAESAGQAARPPARVPASVERDLPRTVPSGGWLRGRLSSPLPVVWSAFRIGLEPETAAAADELELMRRLVRARAALGAIADDGRFELGPVPAGLATVYLHVPGAQPWRSTGHGESLTNRQGIGQVTIEEGAVVERDFEVVELPGSVVVEVRVNGLPAAGLEVELRRDLGGSMKGMTDEHGRFGPLLVLGGRLSVKVSHRGEGWRHAHPSPIAVGPSAQLRVLVPIEVVEARVLFTERASGEPLARRRIALLSAEGIPLSWSNVTDDAGAATFALTPGEYRFACASGGDDGEEFALDSSNRSSVITWTLQGPLVDRVSL